MGYIITIIFIIVSLLCFLEHRVSNEHKSILYWGLAFGIKLLIDLRIDEKLSDTGLRE